MSTIGMLHYRKDPQKVFKSYVSTVATKMKGVGFFYFTPGKVNLVNKRIRKLFYENTTWVERETDYPDVIFNAGGTIIAKQDLIVDALEEALPFTSHSIGAKMSVYYRINKGKFFADDYKPLEELGIDVAKRMIQYTTYLAKELKKGRLG